MTTDLITQYREALAVANALKCQVFDAYMALPTLTDKLLFVLDNGLDFLKEDPWYCPHIKRADGREVSLYDDLYWERRETMDLMDFLENATESLTDDVDVGEQDSLEEILRNYPDQILELDTASAVIVRDMLTKGIGRATYDW